MKSKPIVAVMVALLIGCAAFPVTLHQLSLSRIRELTFTATRFAAATPDALRTLPVTHWEEGAPALQPLLSSTGWEQYRMTIPQGDKSLIVDLDLSSTILPLLLGFGGWLRIVVMLFLSAIVVYMMLRRQVGLRGVALGGDPISASSRAPCFNMLGERTTAMPDNGVTQRQDPPQQRLLNDVLGYLPYAALLFDRHHQLVHWNDSAQSVIAPLTLTSGIHLLDLAAHLPWGNEMIEKMDELSLQQAQHSTDHILMIHKGDTLCVIPG